MMQDNLNNQNYLQEEASMDIKKEAGYYLFFWPYFLAGVIIAMVSAFLYLKTADRIYTSSAQLQIKKPAEDAASFLTGGMEFFGFDQVNVENDIAVLTSQHILSQVVTRLDLQNNIYTVGRVNARLHFNDEYTRFVSIKAPDAYLYWDVEIADDKATFTRDTLNFTINKGDVFKYQESEITLHDSLYLEDHTLIIERYSANEAVADVRFNLIATAASKQGEIINLNFIGVNKKRNEAILNTVMQVMQDDQVEDKRLISKVSLAFINDRLDGLTKSIDTLSQNTIAFQTANGVFDPAAQTSNALSNIVKGQEEAFGLGIQLEIAKALLEKLENQASYQILPANIGIDNESVNTLVDSYNKVVTQRNNLLMSATTKSPMVLHLSSQLDSAKEAIIKGVTRYIEGLETSLAGFKNMEATTKGIVAGLPSKENTLRAYARDFKIVEELYVFLLERKEEASISYISALPNIKLLSYGVSYRFPISPKVQIIYLAALIIGVFVPFGIFFLLKMLDSKINTRDDLENGLRGITVLGEMPFAENTEDLDDTGRGLIAESARVLRSGLSFQLKTDATNVICVTSTIKGEGKSFVSYNLAQSYSALGKKVILVGADLRNPQLHKFLNQKRENIGLTTYLSNENFNDVDSLITKATKSGGLDYLLTGAIPPNPSELLMRSRTKELLDILKQSYDLIIIDSAPLLLVSDTTALLPSIDDGSKSVGMSLKMLEKFDALGITSVLPTPHIYQDLYPNTPTTIKNAFEILTEKTSKLQSPKVKSYAAEYMIDEVFMKNLQTNMPALLLNNEYILVEITFFSETTRLVEAGFTLLQNNITPILAHPERYHSMPTIKEYKELKNKGFLMQLNALSLLGHYGPEVKQKAEKLLKEGLYDFVATDAHNPQHLKNLQNLSLSKKQGIQWEAIREFQLAEFS